MIETAEQPGLVYFFNKAYEHLEDVVLKAYALQKAVKPRGRLRILDIGTGVEAPYLNWIAETRDEPDLLCVDRDARVFEGGRWAECAGRGAGPCFERLVLDINGDPGQLRDRDFPRIHEEVLGRGPFDLIILNATLHELHLGFEEGSAFPTKVYVRRLFARLWDLLRRPDETGPGGTLVLGDYYFPRWLTGREIEFFVGAQRLMTRNTRLYPEGHADPPEAFLHGEDVLSLARDAGFEIDAGCEVPIEPFLRFGSVVDLGDDLRALAEQCGLKFPRLRCLSKRYYIARLTRYSARDSVDPPSPFVEPRAVVADPRCFLDLEDEFLKYCRSHQTLLDVNLKRLPASATPEVERKTILNFLWGDREASDDGRRRGYLDIASDAIDNYIGKWSAVLRLPAPRALTIWPVFHSKVLQERLDAPLSATELTDQYAELERRGFLWHRDVDGHRTPGHADDFCSLAYNAFVHPRGIVTPKRDKYNGPSLHRWLQGTPKARSVTIVYAGELPKPEPWSVEIKVACANALKNHHYIVLPDDPLTWGEALARELNTIHPAPAGQPGWPLPHPCVAEANAIYQAFLWSVFLGRDMSGEVPLDIPEDLRAALRLRLKSAVQQGSRFQHARPRAMTTLRLETSASEHSIGTLLLFSSRVPHPSLLGALTNVCRDAFNELNEIETNYLESRSAAAQERAELIPKWAHGQRTPLFVVKSSLSLAVECLDSATRACADAPAALDHIGASLQILRGARSLTDQAFQNCDLLQEIGHYGAGGGTGDSRWVRELRSLVLPGPSVSLRDIVAQGVRTGLLRLIGIDCNEQSQPYRNAFAKFFRSTRFVAEADDRPGKVSSPVPEPEAVLAALPRSVRNEILVLREALSLPELPDSTGPSPILPEAACRLGALAFADGLPASLHGLFVPVDGTPSRFFDQEGTQGPTTNSRRTIFVSALRLAVEEAVVNYIKHGYVPDRLDQPSLRVLGTVDRYKGVDVVRRARLLFINAVERPVGEARGVQSGLDLCDFVLKSLGGKAQAYRSASHDDVTALRANWPDVRPDDPSRRHWFALEMDLPGCVPRS